MDEHTVGYLTGIGAGVLIGIILVAFILRMTKTNGKIRCEFDERQARIRGTGYKYGFYALITCNILYAVVWMAAEAMGKTIPVETDVAVFMMIFLSVIVMISYLIWHDAYFALNEHRKRVMISFACIALFNLWLGIMSIKDGRVVEDGVLTTGSLNLFCCIMFAIIFVVLLAKHIRESSEMGEE